MWIVFVARRLQLTLISTRMPNDIAFTTHFICGGLAGTFGAIVTCPLELVKTRLQSSLYKSTTSRNIFANISSVFGLLHTIRKQEGITGLWKGVGPTLVGVVPARAIYFSVYSHCKQLLAKDKKETSLIHMMSAATAGLSVALFTNPIWLIKTRMQLQSTEIIYRNSLHCFVQVFKTEGIRGLYRGFSASLLGLSESTLQFVTYEYLKDKVNQQHPISSVETLGCAAAAKLFAAVLTYPHEVVRTRLRQTPQDGVRKYTHLVQTAKLVYMQEGIGALYGGMTAHLMRVVPNAAILFFSYEFLIKLAT